MQTENLVESDPPVVEPSSKPGSSHQKLFFLLHAAAFIAGLAVVIALVYSNRETISKALLGVGWGFVLLAWDLGCWLGFQGWLAGPPPLG